jgi:hypothetical protein
MKKVIGSLVLALVMMSGAAFGRSPCCSGDPEASQACNSNTASPTTVGCVEVGAHQCAGGNLNPTTGGPAGCVCVMDSCMTADGPASAGDCTAAAVAACCANGACHSYNP